MRAVLASGQTYQKTFRVPLAATATGPQIRLRARRPHVIPIHPLETPVPLDRGAHAGAHRLDLPVPEVVDPSPFVVDLGTVAPGTLALGRFFVGNSGDGPLTVSSIGLRSGGAYSPTPLAMPFVVQPDTWTEVTLALGTGGTNPGERVTSEWGVISDDAQTPESVVLMIVRVSGPHLTISTEYLDFGIAPAGQAADKVLTLGNTGSDRLVLFALRWADTKPFTAELPAGATLPLTLDPGASVDVTVRFPAGMPAGDYLDALDIANSGTPPDVRVNAKMRAR
jgi:hypothetical protein